MTDATSAPARPAHEAYLRHIDDGHAWGWCCRDSARQADAEDYRRPGRLLREVGR